MSSSTLLDQYTATSPGTPPDVRLYEAVQVWMAKLDAADLAASFERKTQEATNPRIAIEALRALVHQERLGTTRCDSGRFPSASPS